MLWTIGVVGLAHMLAQFMLGYSVFLSLVGASLGCIQVFTTQPQTS